MFCSAKVILYDTGLIPPGKEPLGHAFLHTCLQFPLYLIKGRMVGMSLQGVVGLISVLLLLILPAGFLWEMDKGSLFGTLGKFSKILLSTHVFYQTEI